MLKIWYSLYRNRRRGVIMIAVKTNETLTIYDISFDEFRNALFESGGLNSERIQRTKLGFTISNNDAIDFLSDRVVKNIERCVVIDAGNIISGRRPNSSEDLRFYVTEDGKQYASEEVYNRSISFENRPKTSERQTVVRTPQVQPVINVSKPQMRAEVPPARVRPTPTVASPQPSPKVEFEPSYSRRRAGKVQISVPGNSQTELQAMSELYGEPISANGELWVPEFEYYAASKGYLIPDIVKTAREMRAQNYTIELQTIPDFLAGEPEEVKRFVATAYYGSMIGNDAVLPSSIVASLRRYFQQPEVQKRPETQSVMRDINLFGTANRMQGRRDESQDLYLQDFSLFPDNSQTETTAYRHR